MTSRQNHPGEHPAEEPAPRGENLGELLTRHLHAVDRAPKELAEVAAVPYATLYAWLNGSRGTSRVPPERLRALASTLRSWGSSVTPREIFEAAGRPVPGPSDEEREQHLIKVFRRLGAKQQRTLIKVAEDLDTAIRSHERPG
ncbi:transcriptional regulator [Streptomyces sp. NPDC005423]|uniref:transcriptional regulator n=1 Tax=Streptomyces sp. NPDC005423 TaxID=3155343 RepID=UPI0033A3D289